MRRIRLRRARGFLIGLLAGMVLAATGVASAKKAGFEPPTEVVGLVTDEPVASDVCALDAGVVEVTEDSSGQDCPPSGGEGEEEEGSSGGGESSSEGRQAECEEAAGMSAEGEEPAGLSGEGGAPSKGLDHAIEVVVANCIKNLQAPGLLNALRHLAENRAKHLAHQEAKAERAAANAERKAAHAEAKAAGKPHTP